jgi:cytochrome c oxidase cbb3-type subunit 1
MSVTNCSLQRVVATHSLAWLTVANLVGIWLALLLVWPRLGGITGAWSYGRWMPLHMDWQLYGWCALPLLGLIVKHFWANDTQSPAVAQTLFLLWGSALLVGGGSWLSGQAAAKPFLNWTSGARWYFALILCIGWAYLALGWWKQRKASQSVRWQLTLAIVLFALACVPIAIFLTSSAKVYPPVDPTSGGATGHSLLASTLGLVALLGLLPHWGLGLQRRRKFPLGILYGIIFALAGGLYTRIEHGNASNTALNQVVGLGSLFVWPPLIASYWRGFEWSASSRLWRKAFLFWWALLTLTGWITFLPPFLDILKFTNGLVAHAHLAMAGAVTALNMILLQELGDDPTTRRTLSHRTPFLMWNFALFAMCAGLFVQGFREGLDPAELFTFAPVTATIYFMRLICGLAMTLVSVFWLHGVAAQSCRERSAALSHPVSLIG